MKFQGVFKVLSFMFPDTLDRTSSYSIDCIQYHVKK